MEMEVENLFEKYETILVFKKQKKIFQQLKGGKPYMVTSYDIRELPYSKIVDKKRSYIRVYNLIDNVKKWGIINSNGNEIVPPLYDYISPVVGKRYFKVFSGDFKWKYRTKSAALYDKLIDNSGWKASLYKSTLGYGKWGLIGQETPRLVIPIAYEWLEFISDQHILCNIGGKRIIKWYDGNVRETKWAIAGGNWEIRNDSKIIINAGTLPEVMEQFNQLQCSKHYPLFKQSIGKYAVK